MRLPIRRFQLITGDRDTWHTYQLFRHWINWAVVSLDAVQIGGYASRRTHRG